MKIEDAKALLIDCTDLICRECNDRHRGCEKQKSYPDFASTVLVALEKQIPKEPEKIEYKASGKVIGRCACGKMLLRHYKGCPECLQAIKWR
jgi:hypothetical protein